MASRTSNQVWSKSLDARIYCTQTVELQTADVAYFERKIQLSGFFWISGWHAVPINPEKWSSTGVLVSP
jgi:hypothetical protein